MLIGCSQLTPSMMTHLRIVTSPVETSESVTVRGADPVVGSAMKSGFGGGDATTRVFVSESLPDCPVMERVTVYVPGSA